MSDLTQSEKAYQEIRHRILILELRPNERLKEEEWATKLGVSRAAIRESLTRLQGEGLVQPGERGGSFVAAFAPTDFRDIKELREILETSAFAMACERATPEQLKEIEETCDDFANMVSKGYLTGACEVDLRFHHLLVAASGNVRLSQAYRNSNIPLFHMKLGRSNALASDFAETEREHRQIAAALRKKSAAEGIELLRQHFKRGEQWVLHNS